jgi:thiol-disulfide isomerase/thioredoxin
MKLVFNALALLIVSIALFNFGGCTAPPTEHNESVTRPGEEKITFAQNVAPTEALSLMPFLSESPLLLMVSADLCAECQALKPVLAEVSKTYPQTPVLDLNLNHKPQCPLGLKNYDALMTAYAPVVTPTLIFIAKGGAVSAILAGNQKVDYLHEAFKKIQLPKDQSPKTLPNPNNLLSCG